MSTYDLLKKLGEVFATSISETEKELFYPLQYTNLSAQNIYIIKELDYVVPGAINENEYIGFFHQFGPRAYLVTKHPSIELGEIKIYSDNGNTLHINKIQRYPALYYLELSSSEPVYVVELRNTKVPNPAFLTYAKLIPNTEYLINTLYLTDFDEFAKHVRGLQKLLRSSKIFKREDLANYINLLLGLPIIDITGEILDIEENNREVKMIILDKNGKYVERIYERPDEASVCIKLSQPVEGYERVFDTITCEVNLF